MKERPKVEKSVALKDFDWLAAEQFYMRRQKCHRDTAWNALERVRLRLSLPTSLFWFRPKLRDDERAVVRALLDAHSCDRLTTSYKRVVPFLVPSCVYQHEVQFQSDEPYWIMKAEILSLGRAIKLDTPSSVVVMYAAVLSLIAVLAGSLAFLLSYGLSVSILLIISPREALNWSLRKPEILLSLLCFLTVLAGFSHRAARNVFLDFLHWWQKKK